MIQELGAWSFRRAYEKDSAHGIYDEYHVITGYQL